MTLDSALHQMSGLPQGGPGRTLEGRGEAASESVSDEAGLARHEQAMVLIDSPNRGLDALLGSIERPGQEPSQ